MVSLKTLKAKYGRLRKNKVNTKALMLELMGISSADFDPDRMGHKLYQCGFGSEVDRVYKIFKELCDDGICIFCGWKPAKVHGRVIGGDPVYGLIAVKE